MASKNITMCQLGDDGAYDKIYPQTSATESEVSADTQKLFGQTEVDGCLSKLADTLKSVGRIAVKVIDSNNNPVEGATVQGIAGNPKTNSKGQAGGISTSNTITVISPYADILNASVDAKDYIGTANILTISLSPVTENTIVRYTSSTSVMFSDAVSSIDVCCVGGGGGGGSSGVYNTETSSGYNRKACSGGGGGGGDVKNFYAIPITPKTNYPIIIGAGGTGGLFYQTFSSCTTSGDGGTTSFMGVSATGGYGGNGWDVGYYYSQSSWGDAVPLEYATQGGLGGGASQQIIKAYPIKSATRFSSGWLSSIKDSTTPLTPQTGVLYRVKNNVLESSTNISNLNGFYIWNGSKYRPVDMTTMITVGGNGGNGVAMIHMDSTGYLHSSKGISSSSNAIEFDTSVKQGGGGAGGNDTSTKLSPGAPNGGYGGATEHVIYPNNATNASLGLDGNAGGGGGGGAGYITISSGYTMTRGNHGGNGGSGLVAIRFHLK